MKRVVFCISSVASFLALNTFAAETNFPSFNRTLAVPVPAECRQWTAPKPTSRKDVDYPSDARTANGEAALLVRIGADGRYLGMEDHLSTDAAFLREAEASVRQWTFTPAICNGSAQTALARVDFHFKREGAITFKSGGAFTAR